MLQCSCSVELLLAGPELAKHLIAAFEIGSLTPIENVTAIANLIFALSAQAFSQPLAPYRNCPS